MKWYRNTKREFAELPAGLIGDRKRRDCDGAAARRRRPTCRSRRASPTSAPRWPVAGHAVLQAPPGAGKTTIVPLRLLDEPWLGGERIVVLEPRRLAARAAAAPHGVPARRGGRRAPSATAPATSAGSVATPASRW